MSSFLKKALGVFVEFDEEPAQANNQPVSPTSKPNQSVPANPSGAPKQFLNQEDIEKFAKHFDALFEKANLPGPDYYEFCKMMETLEAHIVNEDARISAVFASLAIQGMTKQKLIESATAYKLIVDKDKSEFDAAVNEKSKKEIESRKVLLTDLENKIVKNSELIQNLTKEISAAQTQIASVKNEIFDEQSKISAKISGYNIASEAMFNKILTDIQKLQKNL